jgi:peptide deformylase
MTEIGETALANPVIIKHSDDFFISEESCLSLPDII